MHHFFWHLVHAWLAHGLVDLAGWFFRWSARHYRTGRPEVCGTVESDETKDDEPTILRFPLRPPDGGC